MEIREITCLCYLDPGPLSCTGDWKKKLFSAPVPVKIMDQGLEVRDEVVVVREG